MTRPPLDTALADLREAVAGALPPPPVDAAIARAVARAQRRRIRWSPRDRWFAWPLALAATVLVVSLVLRTVPRVDIVPAAEAGGPPAFLPLASPDQIAQAADAYVVPSRVPRAALAHLGLPVDPSRADEPVAAELLVRPDGAVLAFRLLR